MNQSWGVMGRAWGAGILQRGSAGLANHTHIVTSWAIQGRAQQRPGPLGTSQVLGTRWAGWIFCQFSNGLNQIQWVSLQPAGFPFPLKAQEL